MPVAIGEIEVTTAPAPAPPAAQAGADQTPAENAREIDRILHKHVQRSRRLWAY
jgi:hypothetical protein